VLEGDWIWAVDIVELPTDEASYSSLFWTSPTATLNGLVKTQVLNKYTSLSEETIVINNDQSSRFTREHPIFINRNNENTFILAGSIQVGDVLSKHDAQGNIYSEEITSLDVITEECTVHTFNAEPYDLIYANGILTHNK
jgi:hypothetical protein